VVPLLNVATATPGSAGTAAAAPCPVIHGTGDSPYPEAVTWDPTRRAFLVGSVRHGTVSVLRPDGTLATLVSDRRMVSTFGLKVDAAHGRLLVTFGDLGLGTRSTPETTNQLSGLGIFDLATGAPIRLVDLSIGAGPHLANDVALDGRGNAYVTDTLGDAIFRVDRSGRIRGQIRDARFASDGFGLNGIVYHPDGYLLTARYDTGELFRISPDGSDIRSVKIDRPFVGADGFALRRDGSLLVATNSLGVAGGTDAVRVLHPRGNWLRADTGRITAPWPDHTPTSIALTPAGAYVLSGQLGVLLGGDATLNQFTLRRF